MRASFHDHSVARSGTIDVQPALRHVLVVHHEVVEHAHHRALAGDGALLVDRHGRRAVEEIDLHHAAGLLCRRDSWRRHESQQQDVPARRTACLRVIRPSNFTEHAGNAGELDGDSTSLLTALWNIFRISDLPRGFQSSAARVNSSSRLAAASEAQGGACHCLAGMTPSPFPLGTTRNRPPPYFGSSLVTSADIAVERRLRRGRLVDHRLQAVLDRLDDLEVVLARERRTTPSSAAAG